MKKKPSVQYLMDSLPSKIEGVKDRYYYLHILKDKNKDFGYLCGYWKTYGDWDFDPDKSNYLFGVTGKNIVKCLIRLHELVKERKYFLPKPEICSKKTDGEVIHV
jgi:hypothetical protein